MGRRGSSEQAEAAADPPPRLFPASLAPSRPPSSYPHSDPSRECEKVPIPPAPLLLPRPPASGLKRSRVTQEGGEAAWKRLRILSHPLPGCRPTFPTFPTGPGWPA